MKTLPINPFYEKGIKFICSIHNEKECAFKDVQAARETAREASIARRELPFYDKIQALKQILNYADVTYHSDDVIKDKKLKAVLKDAERMLKYLKEHTENMTYHKY